MLPCLLGINLCGYNRVARYFLPVAREESIVGDEGNDCPIFLSVILERAPRFGGALFVKR